MLPRWQPRGSQGPRRAALSIVSRPGLLSRVRGRRCVESPATQYRYTMHRTLQVSASPRAMSRYRAPIRNSSRSAAQIFCTFPSQVADAQASRQALEEVEEQVHESQKARVRLEQRHAALKKAQAELASAEARTPRHMLLASLTRVPLSSQGLPSLLPSSFTVGRLCISYSP